MTATMEPARLINEARRAARRLEFVSYSQGCAAGLAIQKWLDDPTKPWLVAGAVAAVLAIPLTMTLRRRQLQRARWLARTERWWERLDEMPRMEPFPKVVDFVEERLLAAPRRLIGRWKR